MAAEPEIFELSNGRITAKIASWGATITSLLVPDAQGSSKTASSPRILGFGDSLNSFS
jgi:aldose 1-epimerase